MVFDIGGTHFRHAKYVDGTIVASGKELTPSYLRGFTPPEINSLLLELIVKALGSDKDKVTEIGICYAGPVSSKGSILGSPTIHGMRLEAPFELKAAVQSHTGIERVWVMNDLSAAVYRYIDLYSSFELITVSTGVGNKIVINKQLQISADGFEGELGHVPAYLPSSLPPAYLPSSLPPVYLPSSLPPNHLPAPTPLLTSVPVQADGLALPGQEVSIACPCGHGTNHIGAISSGSGMVEVARQLSRGRLQVLYGTSALRTLENLTAESITLACEQGDEFSQHVIDFCTYPLAYAICLTLSSLYLERVILMGGVVLNSPCYFESLLNNILKIGVYNYTDERLLRTVIKGIPDDDSGLIGMYRFLQQETGQ